MPPLADLIRRYLAAEPYRRLSDDDLWARFAGPRDEQAVCALLERCGSRIYARCRSVTGDEHLAEEAFQDTFVELFRHRGRLPTYRAAVAWLYRTATNRARKAVRRHGRALRRDRARAVTTPELIAARAEAELLRGEEVGAVLAALADLPTRQRLVLELVYQEGLTHDETAAALGLTRGAVGVYVARALDRLRSVLSRRGLLSTAAGAAALEAALRARAPALSTERAAALADAVLARLDGGRLTRAVTWAGKWKVLAAGGLDANGGVLIDGPAAKVLGRTLNNAGVAVWSGTGQLDAGGEAVVNNLAGAAFDIRNDARVQYTGGIAAFHNAGTLRKSAGGGESLWQFDFDNDGLVDVQAGALSLHLGTAHANPALDRASTAAPSTGRPAPCWRSAAAT